MDALGQSTHSESPRPSGPRDDGVKQRVVRNQEEIISDWKGELGKPLLTVCCAAYNHEDYIEHALKGFLIQETDFPIEILIQDDASTDRTADIIRKYQTKYPKIIKPICQAVNQWSQGKKPMQTMLPFCKGKYIAYCEGDDFWLDPKKLQVQADFLEANPDYVISGHDAFIIDEDGNRIKDSKLPDSKKRDFSREELILGRAKILTMSWVYRNVIKEYPPERSMVINGDEFFLSMIGHFGKSKFHNDIKPAAYRVHKGGIWSMQSTADRMDSRINTLFWIYRYYRRTGQGRYASHYWNVYSALVVKKIPLRLLLKEAFKKLLYLRKIKSLLEN